MNYILANFFDFSLDKFRSPVVIIGLVLIVIAIMLVAAANKIDEAIRRKKLENKGEDIIKSDQIDGENEHLFKHDDGTFNYYMIIKLTGLLLVIVSAIMIVAGMR